MVDGVVDRRPHLLPRRDRPLGHRALEPGRRAARRRARRLGALADADARRAALVQQREGLRRLVPLVAQQYKEHYEGKGFKKKDFDFSAEHLQVMQIAMIFEVSGRESEIGYNDGDLENYRRYREVAAANFSAYANGKFDAKAPHEAAPTFCRAPQLLCGHERQGTGSTGACARGTVLEWWPESWTSVRTAK